MQNWQIETFFVSPSSNSVSRYLSHHSDSWSLSSRDTGTPPSTTGRSQRRHRSGRTHHRSMPTASASRTQTNHNIKYTLAFGSWCICCDLERRWRGCAVEPPNCHHVTLSSGEVHPNQLSKDKNKLRGDI